MEAFDVRDHLEEAIQSDLNNHPQEEEVHNRIVDFSKSNFPRVYILGDCFGIFLHQRSVEDKHVAFTILVEDGGYWMPKNGWGDSSYWLPDLRAQVFRADEWCKMYALPDLAEFDADRRSVQYGYKFKQID